MDYCARNGTTAADLGCGDRAQRGSEAVPGHRSGTMKTFLGLPLRRLKDPDLQLPLLLAIVFLCCGVILAFMAPLWVAAVLFAPLAALFLLAAFTPREGNERGRDIARLARRLGYGHRRRWKVPASIRSLPHFTRSTDFSAANVIIAEREPPVGFFCFDYESWTSSRDEYTITACFSAVAFHHARQDVPAFQLHPERGLKQLLTMLGAQDIDFAEHPEFSRTCILRGADVPAVRRLFGPAGRNAFAKAPGWSAEGRGAWVVLYKDGSLIEPNDIPGFLSEAVALRRALLP